MLRNSPSFKDMFIPTPTPEQGIIATDPEHTNRRYHGPIREWSTKHQFSFPPPVTVLDEIRPGGTHIVPGESTPLSLYTLISQYNPWLDCEMTREKRAFLTPRAGEMCYPVYAGGCTGGGGSSAPLHFFRNETIMDIVNLYIWPLLHSRADEVVACRTFADWRRLFSQTISLAFPEYAHWASIAAEASVSSTFLPISDRRRIAKIMEYMTPARILYLLTTRAGFWPYGVSPSSLSSLSPRSSRNAGRGICSIKQKIKEYNDKTEIEWLVGADFLRKMKRVHIYFTSSSLSGPFGVPSASSHLLCAYDTDELDL
jgi:hypothetical protein